MKKNKIALILIILSTFLTAGGQFFFKNATNIGINSFNILLTNIPLYLGIICYAFGTILLIYALKKDELSVLYPLFATTFIWVTLISYYFFNEPISLTTFFGLIFIISGVSLLGWSK